MADMAQVGSISSGTLVDADLIEAFEWELRYLGGKDFSDQYKRWENDSEISSDYIGALCDTLQEFAPAYCYFGTHEGDGADYGFWPCFENIEELDEIGDPSDLDERDATEGDCAFTNDHGNVTVFAHDGKTWEPVLELV